MGDPHINRVRLGKISRAAPAGGVCTVGEGLAWLFADGIAAHFGVTKDTVYTWIAEKATPAHKVGRLWKSQDSEIDDWVATRHLRRVRLILARVIVPLTLSRC